MKRALETPTEKLFQEKLQNLHRILNRDLEQTEFCVQGTIDTPAPDLKLQDFDLKLTFPLPESTIKYLKERSTVAPVGKGTETVIDTDIRRGYQIDAKQFSLVLPQEERKIFYAGSDKHEVWKELFGLQAYCYDNSVKSSIKKSFDIGGYSNEIKIQPYRFLIYEEGNYFKPHRDTQRDANHFATVVLFLPTEKEYSGGEFVVRHQGKEKTFDFSKQKGFHWIAFYTDCEHEVLPVTSGYRVSMTFNVLFQGSTLPAPPHTDIELANLLANTIYDILSDQNCPFTSLGFLLSHQYSIATLDPSKLKGKDLLLYQLLTSGEFNRELLVTKEESVMRLQKALGYYSLPAATLKQYCLQRGLKRAGNKLDLATRLEEYDTAQQQQSSSITTPDTSVQIQLPSQFECTMKLVQVTMEGQGGGDDYYGEHHSEYVQAGIDTGFEMTILDPSNNTQLANITTGYESNALPTLRKGSVFPMYGFEGLKYDTPISKDFTPTGNEGTEFTLIYSHAMITIALPKNQIATASNPKKQKVV